MAEELTAEEEALLAAAELPSEYSSLPSEYSAGPSAVPELDWAALELEDQEIRRRTELAMESLNTDRAELRALLHADQAAAESSDAEDLDAGRAERQRELEHQLQVANAEVAAWQPSVDELCGPVNTDVAAEATASFDTHGALDAAESHSADGGSFFLTAAPDLSTDPTSPARPVPGLELRQRRKEHDESARHPQTDMRQLRAEESKQRAVATQAREGLMADLAARDEQRRKMIEDLMGGGAGSTNAGSSSGGTSTGCSCGSHGLAQTVPAGGFGGSYEVRPGSCAGCAHSGRHGGSSSAQRERHGMSLQDAGASTLLCDSDGPQILTITSRPTSSAGFGSRPASAARPDSSSVASSRGSGARPGSGTLRPDRGSGRDGVRCSSLAVIGAGAGASTSSLSLNGSGRSQHSASAKSLLAPAAFANVSATGTGRGPSSGSLGNLCPPRAVRPYSPAAPAFGNTAPVGSRPNSSHLAPTFSERDATAQSKAAAAVVTASRTVRTPLRDARAISR